MFLVYWLLILVTMFTATVFSLMLEIRVIGGFWPSVKGGVKWTLILLVTLLIFSFSSYSFLSYVDEGSSLIGQIFPFVLQAICGTLYIGKFVYDDNMEAIGLIKGFAITVLFHLGAFGISWLTVLGLRLRDDVTFAVMMDKMIALEISKG